MKKTLIAAVAVLLISGCGTGSYSVTSGLADEARLSFTSAKVTSITVFVDEASHDMSSVKDKAWKADRKIKQTAQNTLRLTPGTHSVKVVMDGTEVYSKKLFISASEHKVIEL